MVLVLYSFVLPIISLVKLQKELEAWKAAINPETCRVIFLKISGLRVKTNSVPSVLAFYEIRVFNYENTIYSLEYKDAIDAIVDIFRSSLIPTLPCILNFYVNNKILVLLILDLHGNKV
jgi:hypothetical protein